MKLYLLTSTLLPPKNIKSKFLSSPNNVLVGFNCRGIGLDITMRMGKGLILRFRMGIGLAICMKLGRASGWDWDDVGIDVCDFVLS